MPGNLLVRKLLKLARVGKITWHGKRILALAANFFE